MLEALVGLGHEIHLGGMHVSGLEVPSDRLRLLNLGVTVVDPLAGTHYNLQLRTLHLVRSTDGATARVKSLKEVLLGQNERPPDVVIMPLWFWQATPVPGALSSRQCL
jgi:hypothetical protein